MLDEMDAFLRIEATNEGHDRAERFAQPKPFTQSLFINVLVFEILGTIASRYMPVYLRVPNVVVNTVQHTRKLVLVYFQGVPQTKALVGKAHFPGMLRR